MLKVLILTSKDHVYANYVLKIFLASDVVKSDHVIVLEQDSIIPGKSRLRALLKYIDASGYYYVAAQTAKQYLFMLCRYICQKKMLRDSFFFPYYVNEQTTFQMTLWIG